MAGIYSFIYHFLWESLDWLYPPNCVECNQLGSRWCNKCQQKTNLIQKPFCMKCGIPIQNNKGENILCNQCSSYEHSFQALRSWATYSEGTRNAIHSLKYKKNRPLGETLSQKLLSLLSRESWQFDAIAPIPLSKQRLKERGYNQAALIAFPMALYLNKEYLEKDIIKQADTPSQVGLSISERRQNVADAFYANPHAVKGKSILLIDDVATTCATLDSCARAIITNGAKQVYCLTIARTLS